MYMSAMNRPVMSVSRIARYCNGDYKRTVVLVGNVTDDVRMTNLPALKICALRFTETARARIVAAGGECITFDVLAARAPTGANTLLLRGPRDSREAVKHRGAAGVPGSSTKPYTSGKGRKIERARGRRKSNGFKV
jgi:large subunit ribosomal protein L18e